MIHRYEVTNTMKMSGQELTQAGVYSHALGTTAQNQASAAFTLDNRLHAWVIEESFQIKIDDIDKLILMQFTLTEGLVPLDILGVREVFAMILEGEVAQDRFAMHTLERPVIILAPPNYEGLVEVVREVHRRIEPNIPSKMGFAYATYAAAAPTSGGVIDLLYYNKLAIACMDKHR